MPTYQYACTACAHRFEAVQSFSDPSLSECPECAGRLRKVYSAVGVVFKGSGFYRTDSRADRPERKGEGSSEGKSEGSSEAAGKPEGKSDSKADGSADKTGGKGKDAAKAGASSGSSGGSATGANAKPSVSSTTGSAA